jgi:hypothetical protein
VPNTALRFRPSLPAAQLQTLYAQYGLDGTSSPPDPKMSTGPTPKRETAVVWKLDANRALEPVQIEIGITDHAYTEVAAVIKGDVQVDDNVVTASLEPRTTQAPQ